MTYAEFYTSLGWKLCRIPRGQKGPQTPGWQLRENAIENGDFIDPNENMGLLHAWSRTCCIDIDDIPAATKWLAERGIDLTALASAPDAVQIHSGNPGHGKLIYKIGVPTLSKKIMLDGKNIIDFRCGTAQGTSCQDVLPPSIHPNGNAYQWIGDPAKIPLIPENLYNLWTSEVTERPKIPQSIAFHDLSDDRIIMLLGHIDPSCGRKEWIEIGMALHATGLPQAYQYFDRWSARSPKYKGERDTATQWRSFDVKPNGITPRTLYHRAIQGGWRPDLTQALEMFSSVGNDVEVNTMLEELIAHSKFTPEIDLSYTPQRMHAYVEEVAKTVGCNRIVPTMAGLIAASAAADHRIRLRITSGYAVSPVLWIMQVANPGAKKTPGSRPMFAPLERMEKEDVARFQKLLLLWEAQEAAHAASKKEYLTKAGTIEHRLGNEVLPEVTKLPDRPRPLRLTFSDSTSQKIIRMLDGRPQGLACVMDEAGNWLRKMVDPRSGEDRSMWLVGYESNAYTYDRVGAGSIRLENMSISVFGNVQINLVDSLVDQLQTDGFSQRFIPVYIPTETQSQESQPIEPWMSEAAGWEQILREIYSQGQREYTLDPESQRLFREFESKVERMKWQEQIVGSPSGMQSSVSKFLGLLGRLSLVFHLIDNPGRSEVPSTTVEKAISFIEDFVYWNISRFYGKNEFSFTGWLFDWLICGQEQTVTESDIRRAGRRQLDGKTLNEQKDQILMALHTLQKYGVVVELMPEMGSRSAVYAINPAIHEKYAAHRQAVVAAREEQEANRRRIVEGAGKTVNRKWSPMRKPKNSGA
jgi:hypothetical protein